MDTFEKVKQLISDKLGVEGDKITEKSSFVDDLGADSLDLVDLVMALEDEFGIKVDDDKLEKFVTVGDVVQYINSVRK
ncbi:MAG: acyl carrier protein [Athalassotoga sp.]|uniref:acyl carrier protein n=1 Tax=Athalassotoga TaxID=1769718 RepID=UPI00137B4B79|nr:acyl carrier protein [Athalassotoga saccharophila]BBJ27896.1 acyl carrier protein [Athalassotoga saccharophila]